jgi:hypothetical protein
MSWGTVELGRLTVRETVQATDKVNASTGVRTLVLTGQESYPPLETVAELEQRREDIMGLQGLLIPVAFTDKPNLNGYYTVTDTGASETNWQGEAAWVDWNVSLALVGPANAVDLEDRLTAAGRVNDHGLTGTSWHAPAVGAYGYWTGAESPSGTVSRVGSDGTVTVFLDLPEGVNPRWGADLADYPGGRVRFTLDSYERTGTNLVVSGSAWTLDNSLVRVRPEPAATISVDAWDSGAWATKAWNVTVGGSTGANVLGTPDGVTVLRNDYELATVRLVWDRAPGRAVLDLTLRRGSRTVEGYLQTGAATVLAVVLDSAESGTAPASAGYATASADDAAGNRYVAVSARSFTGLVAQGGLSKTDTRTLDFALGVALGGSAAQTGDTAANLVSQYLMAMADTTWGVKR